MLTAGPTGSEGGAARLLLVNCTRVSLTIREERVADIARRDRLVRIVKIGGGAGCAQSARSPRIHAVDVVQAVASAELIFVAETGDRLSRRSSRCGPDSDSGPSRSAVPDTPRCRSRALMAATLAGAMRDKSRLVQVAAFEIGEIEGPVVHERARQDSRHIAPGSAAALYWKAHWPH